MKFRRLHVRALPVAAAFGLALLAAPMFAICAHAFTFEDQGAATSDGGAANIADPADRLTSRYNSGDQTVIKQGDTTFRFGGQPQSFDQRYNTDRMFDPNGRPGDIYGR